MDHSSLDLGRKGDDLLIRAAGHSHVFLLPDSLLDAEVEGASYRDGQLVVTFAPPA